MQSVTTWNEGNSSFDPVRLLDDLHQKELPRKTFSSFITGDKVIHWFPHRIFLQAHPQHRTSGWHQVTLSSWWQVITRLPKGDTFPSNFLSRSNKITSLFRHRKVRKHNGIVLKRLQTRLILPIKIAQTQNARASKNMWHNKSPH